ncbi:MAG TPA: 16S rRNA (guanine(966)-N(2))-methyltransferase RsmD [Frankiaceae bacterium]|nr:16S rRNA (guanine(966)-N(2))-methyltransferase RsmD [Frankiaceae bacterium]
MTRIVAGLAGGRRLSVPAGRRTRPTSERAREGLFSSLGDLSGARFLDLFAGSGAVGLEALSRGASAATLVESDAGALRVLRSNATGLGLPGVDVRPSSVERFLDELVERDEPGEPYDVVFLDPPYALDIDPVLRRALVAIGDVVVVERATRDGAPTWPDGVVGDKVRRYGDTALWYGRRS